MAAFIVISANNQIHYLVDGIEKCRPLNNDISAEISTGKITKTENGYVYNYTSPGKGSSDDTAKTFSNRLSNQLAAFRTYTISQNELVNIFFLENPLTKEDFEKSESWLKEFENVNKGGRDANFCLYRILFTYNLDNPTDVCEQIDKDALQKLLDNHKQAIKNNPDLGRYLFYIDNQKRDAAALCLSKEEHDLKMPRILMDFMMLVSNSNDKYNIINAIKPPTVNTRCFSIGYAESMYYYPDVERYFIHADNRDILNKILTSEDEKSNEAESESMDVEKYPFGLRSRLKRLAVIYEDVSLSENIKKHPTSADYKIDECIVELQDLLEQERKKEIEDFNNSSKVVNLEKEKNNLDEQISSVKQSEDETVEEYNNRIQQLRNSKDKLEKDLEQLKQSFEPECPEYINRSVVYTELCVADEKDKDTRLKSLSDQYRRLEDFAKSEKFYNFVETQNEEKAKKTVPHTGGNNDVPVGTKDLSNNPGCLPSWILFWRKRSEKKTNDSVITNTVTSTDSESKDNKLSANDCIISIKEQLELKKKFAAFKDAVNEIERDYNKEKKYCEEFKLSSHENLFFPLIDYNELKNKHAETSKERIQNTIDSWKSETEHTKTNLLKNIEEEATKHTKQSYSFIDWSNPFSFVNEVSVANLPHICNGLQKRAAPIVHYNLTANNNVDNVVRYFYSDRPQFTEEMKNIRNSLDNGNTISAIKSTHIASKICMFQFLPMDEDVLCNLVDLQVQDEMDIDNGGNVQHLQDDSSVIDVNTGSTTDDEPIDWGEH